MSDTTEIATGFSVGDYRRIRVSLDPASSTTAEWEKVLSAFKRRIRERFLRPVREMARYDKCDPLPFRPGAAILALDCLLIDTLESFREGRGSTNEISAARSFKTFLKSKRFAEFNSDDRSEFFGEVRSGLLHNGETRGNWKFRIDVRSLLEKDRNAGTRTINRRIFHARVAREFREICHTLRRTDADGLRARGCFLRRMDAICGIEGSDLGNFYFAYGSNLLRSELARTCSHAEDVGKAFLPRYRLTFSKHSLTRKGDAASIERHDSCVTWGFVYRMNTADKEALAKREGGYGEIPVDVFLADGEDVSPQRAFTFVGEVICTKNCGPAAEYLDLVLDGAKSRDLPEEYRQQIASSFAAN